MTRRIHMLFLLLATAALAAGNPEDIFFDAANLAREATDAESRADWPAAYAKYDTAIKTLRQLRATHPDWNAPVVEFRIRAYTDHLNEIKSRLPVVPEPAPPPPPPAPDTAQIKADLDAARAQASELATQLAIAKAGLNDAKQTTQQLDNLTRQNEQLKAQLAGDKDAVVKTQAERERLAAELEKSRTELERARQAAEQAATLAKQNQELATQLAGTQKQAASENSKVRDELERARAELAAAQQQSTERDKLATDLTATRANVEQLTGDLAKARDQLKQIETADQKIVALTQSNTDLATQFATLQQAHAGKLQEAADELEKTRQDRDKVATDLGSVRAELETFRQSGNQLAEAQKQNELLHAQLDELRRRPPAVIVDLRDALLETGANIGRENKH